MTLERRLYKIVFGFVDIAAGLVAIFTLGSVYPNWALNFAAWYALRDIKKRKDSKQ